MRSATKGSYAYKPYQGRVPVCAAAGQTIGFKLTQGTTIKRTQNMPVSRLLAAATVALALTGCAATIGQDGLAQRTSIAIGREVGSFTISDQRPDTGGRIDYNVRTKDGAQYQCYVYPATGFQSVMSLGNTSHSDAICSKFSRAQRPQRPPKCRQPPAMPC